MDVNDSEFLRWSRIFSGSSFYYGHGPGPVARRAVRYHRPLKHQGGKALDAGSGEGQDLVFLAQSGYDATGLEWTPAGIAKTHKLLADTEMSANVIEADLRDWRASTSYDLVLAVNSLQFLGAAAPEGLRALIDCTAPGGVLGVSVFARENADDPALDGTLYRWTLEEMLANFTDWQPFEAARLWQWGASGPQPFVTLIAGRL